MADVWSGSLQLSGATLYPLAGGFAQYMYNNSTADQFFALINNQAINGACSIYGKGRIDSLIADFNKQMEF